VIRLDSLDAWRRYRGGLGSGTIGFVPTMGALHEGHASLLARSRRECAHTVLSIYVNPTQFNDPKDLAAYPRSEGEDLALAASLGVDAVLLPRYDDLYADGFRFRVDESEFSRTLCGAHRPGHFAGVLTVVMKLLHLVRPTRAYFGEKDYQQYALIRDMAAAFFMDVEIVPCATARAADGLALSSRNQLLDAAARRLAPTFPALLREDRSDAAVAAALEAAGFAVDYVATVDQRRFGAVVVQCGTRSVRLIDNVPLGNITQMAPATAPEQSAP
jgi:pantoate--beta-alanine ligase